MKVYAFFYRKRGLWLSSARVCEMTSVLLGWPSARVDGYWVRHLLGIKRSRASIKELSRR